MLYSIALLIIGVDPSYVSNQLISAALFRRTAVATIEPQVQTATAETGLIAHTTLGSDLSRQMMLSSTIAAHAYGALDDAATRVSGWDHHRLDALTSPGLTLDPNSSGTTAEIDPSGGQFILSHSPANNELGLFPYAAMQTIGATVAQNVGLALPLSYTFMGATMLNAEADIGFNTMNLRYDIDLRASASIVQTLADSFYGYAEVSTLATPAQATVETNVSLGVKFALPNAWVVDAGLSVATTGPSVASPYITTAFKF